MWHGNAFSHVSLSVCPVHAANYESLDLQTSSMVCKYIFRTSTCTSSLYIKLMRLTSPSHKQKSVSVCPIRALSFEYLDLKLHFQYAGTSSEYLVQGQVSKSLEQERPKLKA